MATSSKTEMKLGNFTIDVSGHIGSGAMGVVHPATDAKGNKVAAKRICGKSDRSMEKVSKDLYKLTQLNHPNIVDFYDIKHIKSTIWLVMEYCPHKDLDDFFRKQKLNKRQTFVIMDQITRGLEYLHRRNIIHRDIKPSNILVKSNDPIWVKVTDFDFSKFLEEHFDTSLMTSNVGTPAFKAPEFFLRNEEQQIRYHRNVDVFALGLTFLAMIQENKGLVPRIETPSNPSEKYEPIGRLIAQRIKSNKKPLDVIPKDKKKNLIATWFSKLQVSSSAAAGSAKPVSDEVTLMKQLIRQMTHHEPENRPSAAQVVADLDKIGKMMGYAPEDMPSAVQVTEDGKETNFDIPQHVDLQLLTTNETGLQFWGDTRFTVMESGIVVLWGKTSEQTPAALHLYNTSTGFTKLREVKGLCEHDQQPLLPVTMNNKELLAVSCPECQMIRLLDVENEDVTVAFHDSRFYPHMMSHGEGDVMYVVHAVKGAKPVLELNTTQVPFTGPVRTIQSGMEIYFGLCYIPSPHRLIVLTWWKDSIIRAVSAETGEKVWEVKGEVDGVKCDPNGMLFSPQHQVLLVADGENCRVLVLHPGDGSHLQTLQLDREMGAIAELCLHQNKLVVQHNDGRKEKVTYFSIN